jgi:hypothetical protein
MSFVGKWIELEFMLSEINQTEKDMLSHRQNLHLKNY